MDTNRRGVIIGGAATAVALPVGFYLGRSLGNAAVPPWAMYFIWQLGMELAVEVAAWGFKKGIEVLTEPNRDKLPLAERKTDIGRAHTIAVHETAASMRLPPNETRKLQVLEEAQARLRGLIRNIRDYDITKADDVDRLRRYIEETNYIYERFVDAGAPGLQASMNALNVKIALVQKAIFEDESDELWPIVPETIALAKARLTAWKDDVDRTVLPAIFPKLPPPPPRVPQPPKREGFCSWLPIFCSDPPAPPPPPAPSIDVEKQRSDLYATSFQVHHWRAESMIKDWERIREPDCDWLKDLFRTGCGVKT